MLYFAIFGITLAVFIAVGFIGNKAVDKTENALHSRKVKRQNLRNQNDQPESLASRFNMAGANIPVQQTHSAAFCIECGEKIDENSKFCRSCGAKIETYNK